MRRLYTLGEFAIGSDGGPESPLAHVKRNALLVYLAAANGRGAHARDTVQAIFWPEADQRRARDAMKQLTRSLRTDLDDRLFLDLGSGRIALDSTRLGCDARELAEAHDGGDHESAVELFRGDFLPGFHLPGCPAFDEWVAERRLLLRDTAARSARLLTEEALLHDDMARASDLSRRVMELDPFDEATMKRRIELLVQRGEGARAIAEFEAFDARLREELGIAPDPSMSEAIESARAAARRAAPVGPTPARGRGVMAVHGAVAEPMTGRRPPARTRVAGALVAALVLLAGGWAFSLAVRSEGDAEAARVALVPFRTLGGSDSTFFGAGLTDEVRIRLATLEDVSLVLGADAGDGASDSAASLPTGLDVDFVLTGTVRWERDEAGPARVRVVPSLVRTEDRTEVWTATYETYLEGLFDVQASIAQAVTTSLGARLGVVATDLEPPTDDPEAYTYYLRGKEMLGREWVRAPLLMAANMFEEAVRRDPGFARAWAGLSLARSELHMGGWEPTLDMASLAADATDAAERLDREDPEVLFASAMLDYRVRLDYETAAEKLDRLDRRRPNDPEALLARAYIARRRGRWEESLVLHRRVLDMRPLTARGRGGLAWTLINLRRYEEARAVLADARARFPEMGGFHETAAVNELIGFGDAREARAILEEASRDLGIRVSEGTWRMLLTWEGEYDAAAAALEDELETSGAGCVPCRVTEAPLDLAELYRRAGDLEARRRVLDMSRTALEVRVADDPDDAASRSLLAIAYAGLGRDTDALEQAEVAVESMPFTRDALEAPRILERKARVHAMVGDTQTAVELLDFVLGIPSEVSVELLEHEPRYDPLRSDAQFLEMLERHRNP